MKYIILRKGFGEGCDYTIGCNVDWEIRDFGVTTIRKIQEILTKESLYGGDSDCSPEDYNRIDNMDGQIKELIIIPISDELLMVDMDLARKKHNEFHDKIEQQEKEYNEKKELERLKKKYDGDNKK